MFSTCPTNPIHKRAAFITLYSISEPVRPISFLKSYHKSCMYIRVPFRAWTSFIPDQYDLHSWPVRLHSSATGLFLFNIRLATTYQKITLTDCGIFQEFYVNLVTTSSVRFVLPTFAYHGTYKYIAPLLAFLCYVPALYIVCRMPSVSHPNGTGAAFQKCATLVERRTCAIGSSAIWYFCFNGNFILFLFLHE